MPPRPFPYQIGIGTDIVHVNRIRAILGKADSNCSRLKRFLRRFLTPREQDDFLNRQWGTKNATTSQLHVASRYLAGRWAAKEATIKAVSWRCLSFHDIVISRAQTGGGIRAVILDKKVSAFEASKLAARSLLTDGEVQGPCRDDVLHNKGNSSFAFRCAGTSGDVAHEDDALHSSTKDRGSKLASVSTLEEEESALSGQIAKISISHDGEYATAVCLAAEESMDGDVGGEATASELS